MELINVEDFSDVEDIEIVDDDTEPVNKDDIFQFIADLGIQQHRPNFKYVFINAMDL